MKTTISIPDSLFKSVEDMAKRLGISRSELFQRAMRSFLKEHKNKEITEALNAVCFNQSKQLGLDPVLERLQRASITREEW